MGIKLGAISAVKPRNVADIKPIDVINFVKRFAQENPAWFDIIKARVNSNVGRPRRLTVETLIGAAVAASLNGTVLVRSIASLLISLDIGDQRLLGVRWTDPNGGGEKTITERQVAYLFSEIATAFNETKHIHPQHIDEYIISSDGEILGDAHLLTTEELQAFQCEPNCPAFTTMENMGNQLLAELHKALQIPDTGRYALDSYLIETFFATKSWGKKADIDPAWVSDKDKNKVEKNTYKSNKKKSNKKKSKKEEEQEARQRRSRRIPAIGPTVKAKKGKFHTNSQSFPQLRPDGRLAHTKDHGAANGYQGAGASRKSGIANGRDKHALVSSGHLPNGQPIPQFLRAYVCPPGGDNKSKAALNVLNLAKATGVQPGKVSLDRIYTASPAEDLEHIVAETGWQLIKDLKDIQRRRHQHETGIRYIDGWWYTTGIQPGLLAIPRPPQNAKKSVKEASQRRFDQRRPYAFRKFGTTTNGGLRLRGPAVPDSVQRDAQGNASKVRGMRVRCINSLYYHLGNRLVPKTACVQGNPCSCSKTITIRKDEMPNSVEPLLWGTTEWAKEYYRRNMVETFNSIEEHHHRFKKDSIRVRAERWDFAHLIFTTATLLKTFYNWLMKLGAHTLDPTQHTPFDQEVIDACIKRVMKPSASLNAPPTG